MWYRVYADGSEIDIVHAYSPKEAIDIVKKWQGCENDSTTVWTTIQCKTLFRWTTIKIVIRDTYLKDVNDANFARCLH